VMTTPINIVVFQKPGKHELKSAKQWASQNLTELNIQYSATNNAQVILHGHNVQLADIGQEAQGLIAANITEANIRGGIAEKDATLSKEARRFFKKLRIVLETQTVTGKQEHHVDAFQTLLFLSCGFEDGDFDIRKDELEYVISGHTGKANPDAIVSGLNNFIVVDENKHAAADWGYYQLPCELLSAAMTNDATMGAGGAGPFQGDQEIFGVRLKNNQLCLFKVTFTRAVLDAIRGGLRPTALTTIHSYPTVGLSAPHGPYGLRLSDPAERQLAIQYLCSLRILLATKYNLQI